jgi:predicted phosphodiesterase
MTDAGLATASPASAGAQLAIAINGALLVFGGPYGNLEATRAILDEARKRCIPAEHVVCTGDIVAYCADPQPVIDLIRASGIRLIAGNCEEALAAGAEDCGCGFPDDGVCAALSNQWYPHVDRCVATESRIWMGTLPRRLDLEIEGCRLAVVHGGVTRSNRFVFAFDDAALAEELADARADGVIAGHCGLPFTRVLGGRLWHNAGVIGMPANDGTPRVWFSTITPTADGLAVERHAMGYDHATAAAKLRERGLPEGYATCLETGFWPSVDVLPAAERARRGIPLTAGRVIWRYPSSAGGNAHGAASMAAARR